MIASERRWGTRGGRGRCGFDQTLLPSGRVANPASELFDVAPAHAGKGENRTSASAASDPAVPAELVLVAECRARLVWNGAARDDALLVVACDVEAKGVAEGERPAVADADGFDDLVIWGRAVQSADRCQYFSM